MATLLVQACSKSKHQTTSAVPAIDLYDGYFFRIIKKAMREGQYDSSIDLCILSAEHGLIQSDTTVQWYDRRMSRARARQLNQDIREALSAHVTDSHDEVIVNVGRDYQPALDGIGEYLSIPVEFIDGEGIGEKGRKLKHLVRERAHPMSSRD